MSIDFRVRPPIASYRTAEFYTCLADVEQRAARFGVSVADCARDFSMATLLAEMDDAGVELAVVPIRKGCGGDNTDLARLVADHPGRFAGLAGIAPLAGMDDALAEVQACVINGPCCGIALEPAFDPEPWYVDDARVFPLYELCAEHGIPVAFTYGGIFTPALDLYDPLRIDRVARLFPGMHMALCHGGWPYVTESCQIAFNRSNVYLAPDMYMLGGPGTSDYVAAAGSLLYDKVMFASAAPIISIRDAAKRYTNCGIVKEKLPYVMEWNARRFLRL